MLLIDSKVKLTIVFMLLIGCSLTSAAIITVDDQCTLADALNASSQDIKSGDCKAGSGIDTIVLPSNGHYVIPIRGESNNDFDQIESISIICKSTVIIKSCPS
jgi:hypothetical protein